MRREEGKYSWIECDILDCFNKAAFQHAATGRVVCKDHLHELAPIHQGWFVEVDGGKKPKK